MLVQLGTMLRSGNGQTPCRIGTVGTERFFGNEFLEVGLSGSQRGKFGTTGPNPPGFFGRRSSSGIGMVGDNDGFGTGLDLRIDYFLPGSPEERWNVALSGVDYNIGAAWDSSYAGPTLDSATAWRRHDDANRSHGGGLHPAAPGAHAGARTEVFRDHGHPDQHGGYGMPDLHRRQVCQKFRS